jgi:hypothetical protein
MQVKNILAKDILALHQGNQPTAELPSMRQKARMNVSDSKTQQAMSYMMREAGCLSSRAGP